MTNKLSGATFKILFFCILFLVSGQKVLSQSTSDDMEEFMFNSSKDFIEFEDYESAYDLLLSLDSVRPNNPDYSFNIGLCLYLSIDKVKSLLYFLKAKQLGFTENILNYYLGLSYRFNYDLDNAVYYLQYYLDHGSSDNAKYEENKDKVTSLIAQIESSRKVLNQRLSVGVRNMGEKVNSEYADYVPILLAKDSILIFTSRRKGSTGGKLTDHGVHFEDVYIAKKNRDGEWGQLKQFPGFNGRYHDANVAINQSETELYLYKAKRNGSIYVSKKNKNGEWLKPKPLKRINSKYWEGSIGLSPTEDTIFFSSDRPGGFGESDLYLAVRDSKGNWSNIRNMGETINSPFDEDSPYMYKDGRTFFFSSRGHNSIGGYDVFSTKLINNNWSEVKNIGFPINTIDDDIYFQLNSSASFGYFTSFRHSNFKEKSIGEKDLFEIVRPNSSPVYFVFKGRVYDEETKEALPAIVTLKDKEDSTSANQTLVVDINSGKFRYDLKFNNRYQLNIEVGDKVYFSKELYFPYQPDLFESFLDIPLKNIPAFKVKLQDLLAGESDTSDNLVLDESINPTVILVRHVPANDRDLKDLLLSKRIPVSFRKRIMDQLKGTPYIDEAEEGSLLNNAFSEIDSINSLYSDENVFQKLSIDGASTIERIDAKNLLNFSPQRDTVLEKSLSDLEKRIVNRLSDYFMSNDSAVLHVVDELYYKELSQEELQVVTKMVAKTIDAKIETNDSTDVDRKKLYELIDHNREVLLAKKLNVKGFNREAWGLLYTIEVSRFKYEESERLVFKGKVTHRINGGAASHIKLLLTDDRGMIYAQGLTSPEGEITFQDIIPGKRYHILVDDYSIAILGRSRYDLKELIFTSREEDHLKFYKNLSSEQKRAIDRLVALNMLNDDYSINPIHEWEDDALYLKLSEPEKKLVDQITNYLSTQSIADKSFFLSENLAHQYEQLDLETRDKFNRFIARRIRITKADSLLFVKLSEKERNFIDQIKSIRQAKRIVIEDILLSKEESDFWYVLDEINTEMIEKPKAINLSGKITYIESPAKNLQVALMDEFGQIVSTSQTDDSGRFFIPFVQPDSKFKVLINNGSNITRIRDYKLIDLKIEGGGEDFYKNLTHDEKRIVDRIIATNLSNEFYQQDPDLLKGDVERYTQLSVGEKEFIDRLIKHLYADPVVSETARLQKQDNHHYYSNLTIEQRNFINRYIVQMHANEINLNIPVFLKGKDKIFYDRLTENEKTLIQRMQNQRRLKADIFAENPELIVDKAWILMDSISNETKNELIKFTITGDIVEKQGRFPVYNMPVMVSNEENSFMGMVSTDSSGHFEFNNISLAENYYILAESKRIFADQFKYELINLKLTYSYGDSSQREPIVDISKSNNNQDTLIVYFDFDSYKIKPIELKKLNNWLKANPDLYGTIRLDGHADMIGPEDYNQRLSEKRAEEVKRFLIQNGIKDKIGTFGYGEKKHRYKLRKLMHLDRRVDIIFR